MRRSQFESFIRTGRTRALVLNLFSRPVPEVKQDAQSMVDSVDAWMEEVWNPTYGAALQAILKARPFEFSTEGLADQDKEALRDEASAAVLAAMVREGFLLESAEGRGRALSVLFAYLNRTLQVAIGIDFYTWQTRRDAQVRESHVERDGKIFRWDTPPEGAIPAKTTTAGAMPARWGSRVIGSMSARGSMLMRRTPILGRGASITCIWIPETMLLWASERFCQTPLPLPPLLSGTVKEMR